MRPRPVVPHLLFALWISAAIAHLPASAETLLDPAYAKLPGQILSALKELQDGLDNFNSLKQVTEAIDRGEKPTADRQTDWQPLVRHYDEAASLVSKAPLVTDFDPTPFQVSIGDLKTAEARAAAITKLDGYAAELQAAVQRGTTSLAQLEQAINDAETSRSILDKLIRLSVKLAAVPEFGQIFLWNWFDLDTAVRPALSNLISELKRHKNKLGQEVSRLTTASTNLQANLQEIHKAQQASFDGKWESNDPDKRFRLEITGTTVVWIERNKGAVLSRQVILDTASNKITRPNDDSVLTFLGYQQMLRAEIMARGPQPSFMILTRQGPNLVGQWNGLLVTKDKNAHLKELKQPGQAPTKTFDFLPAP